MQQIPLHPLHPLHRHLQSTVSTVFRAIVLPRLGASVTPTAPAVSPSRRHHSSSSTPSSSHSGPSRRGAAYPAALARRRPISAQALDPQHCSFSTLGPRLRATSAVEARAQEYEYDYDYDIPDPWVVRRRYDQHVSSSSGSSRSNRAEAPLASSPVEAATVAKKGLRSEERAEHLELVEDGLEEVSRRWKGKGKEVVGDEGTKGQREGSDTRSLNEDPARATTQRRRQPPQTNPYSPQAEQRRKLAASATLPPALARLVSSRLFRMAVFYLYSHESYSRDPAVIEALARELDKGGAVLQARRLRRGLKRVLEDREVCGTEHGVGVDRRVEAEGKGEEGKMSKREGSEATDTLFTGVHQDPLSSVKFTTRGPPRPGNYHLLPRSYDVSRPPNLTRQQRLTLEYNTQLSYLTFPPPAAVVPFAFQRFRLDDPRNPRFRKGRVVGKGAMGAGGVEHGHDVMNGGSSGANVSGYRHGETRATRTYAKARSTTHTQSQVIAYPPVKRLKHLRQLLTRIDTLVQHRGFVPDRVTANIVIKCWIDSLYRSGYDANAVTRPSETEGLEMMRGEELGRGADRARGQGSGGQPPLEQVLAMTAAELESVFNLVSASLEPPPTLTERDAPTVDSSSNSTSTSTSPSSSSARSTPHASPFTPIAIPSTSFDIFQLARERPDLAPAVHEAMTSEISYDRHVRPFGLMVSRALGRAGAVDSQRRVREWMKRWRLRTEGHSFEELEVGEEEEGEEEGKSG